MTTASCSCSRWASGRVGHVGRVGRGDAAGHAECLGVVARCPALDTVHEEQPRKGEDRRQKGEVQHDSPAMAHMAPEGHQTCTHLRPDLCHRCCRRRRGRAAAGEQLRWRVAWELVEDAVQWRYVPGRGRRIGGDGREHRAVRLEVGGGTGDGVWVSFVHVVPPTVRTSTRASSVNPGGSSIGQDMGSGSPRDSASSRRRKSRAKPDSSSSRPSQRAHSARTSARRSSSLKVAVSSIVTCFLSFPREVSPRSEYGALSGVMPCGGAPSQEFDGARVGPAAPEKTLLGQTHDAGRPRRRCPGEHDNVTRRLRHSRHVIRSPTSHRWRRPRRRPPHGLSSRTAGAGTTVMAIDSNTRPQPPSRRYRFPPRPRGKEIR